MKTKVLFAGTPDFAIPSLQKMHAHYDVVGVITPPDRPRNRNQVLPTPVKEEALRLGLPVFTPDDVNAPEVLDELRELGAEFIVEVAFGKLLKPEFLDLAKDKVLNVHPSLLPNWRGAAPLLWPILFNEEKTGVTIMLVDEGMDTGDILRMEEVDIANKYAQELHDELAEMGAELLVEVIDNYDNIYQNRVQQVGPHTYAKKITKEMGRITPEDTADGVLRKVRAFYPKPGAYFILEGKRIQVSAAQITDETPNAPGGTVYKADNNGIYMKMADTAVLLTKIKPEGKKEMEAAAFARGKAMKFPLMIETN